MSAGARAPHRGLITLSIMLATVMQVLDTTIANVALPSMTGDLGASRDKLHEFLCGWLGGPPLYEQRYGHPRLRARHPSIEPSQHHQSTPMMGSYLAI